MTTYGNARDGTVSGAAKIARLEKRWRNLLSSVADELLMLLVGMSDDTLLEAMEEVGVDLRHDIDPEQLPIYRDKLRDMVMAEARERAKRGAQ
jgi:hypothetical protein